MRQVANMGYGDAYSDSVKPLNSQSEDIMGVAVAVRDLPTSLGPIRGPIASEIRHPLSAIMANANAARRWLNRPDPNLAEALAALARIVRDGARIDEMI
jgi:hypothetical protein